MPFDLYSHQLLHHSPQFLYFITKLFYYMTKFLQPSSKFLRARTFALVFVIGFMLALAIG